MPDAAPAPQFADLRQQSEVAQLGMWVFLATEVLFFGGLILLYCVYRFGYPAGFAEAARHTKIVIGTVNTAVLLTSSFAVAWAVAAAKEDEGRLAAILLCVAALLGVVFLGLKARRISRRISRTSGARVELLVLRGGGGQCRAVLHLLFHRHRPACAASADRHRCAADHGAARRRGALFRALRTIRSRSLGSTGTSSTWSGFSCSR